MTQRIIAVHLVTEERQAIDDYLAATGTTMSELIRQAACLGCGRLGVSVVTNGYASLVQALNDVGSSLNGASHYANLCAYRYGRLSEPRSKDVDAMLSLLASAEECAERLEGGTHVVEEAAAGLVTCSRFVVSRPEGRVTSHAFARVDEETHIEVGSAAAAQGRSRSSFVKDLMLLVVAFGGVGNVDAARVALVQDRDEVRLERAVRRWETNEEQLPVALGRVRRRHEFSAALDSIAAGELVSYCESCQSSVGRACAEMRRAVAPFLSRGAS